MVVEPSSREVGAQARAYPAALNLGLAAFGTLSNGSDVRLLATPEDVDLPSAARSAIERFFYSAWKGAATRRAPYFAFHRLTSETDQGPQLWGLSKASALGRGATGEVVVVWTAILDEDQLASIDWATHRLLASAFPDTVYLPAPETRTASHRAELLVGEAPQVSAYDAAFDRVAYQLTPEPGRRVDDWRAVLSVRAPLDPSLDPLSPEGALFGLWDRLGRWRAGLSYCTWAEIEKFSDARPESRFALLLGESEAVPPAQPGRQTFVIGGAPEAGDLEAPPAWWLMHRQVSAGVAIEPQARQAAATDDDADADGAKLALALFEEMRAAPMKRAPFFLEKLAQEFSSNVRTAQRMVASTALNLLKLNLSRMSSAEAGDFIETYLPGAMPLMKVLGQEGEDAVAQMVVDDGLMPHLSSDSLELLSAPLWGHGRKRVGMIAEMRAAVDAAEPGDGSWEPLLDMARAHARDGAGELDLCLRLIVACRADERTAEAAKEALSALSIRPGFRALLPVLSGAAPSAVRRALFVDLCMLRPRPTARRQKLSDKRDLFALFELGKAIDRASMGSFR